MRAKKRKVVRHEETIKQLIKEFTGGIKTVESFLSSLSHCVVTFNYTTCTELFIDTHLFSLLRKVLRK